jgi:predicted ATPase
LILYADAARLAGLSEVGWRALDEVRRMASFRPSFVEPEIDRLAAGLVLQAGGEPALAEEHLRVALATARDRGALALELRAATDLRRLELVTGRNGDAATILRAAVEKFTEGHDLPDLRDAIELLDGTG